MSAPFTIYFGSNSIRENVDYLRNGFDLNDIDDLGIKSIISIDITGNNLNVSAEIDDSNNVTIAKIANNDLQNVQNSSLVYDRNYNTFIFEVVDSYLVPILQIRLGPSNSIYIERIVDTAHGRLLAVPGSISSIPSGNVSGSINPLFEYPSASHLGKTIKPLYDSGDAIENATLEIAFGAFLLAIGLVFIVFSLVNYAVIRKEKKKREKIKMERERKKMLQSRSH
jgi:hypothetical protein